MEPPQEIVEDELLHPLRRVEHTVRMHVDDAPRDVLHADIARDECGREGDDRLVAFREKREARRQLVARIALAISVEQELEGRTLVHDPAVLLLDEATSSLDATTERAVMDNLRQLRATRIVIAHRPSTIVRADQIVVIMQEGRIVEVSTHDELLRRRGIYTDLVADQTFQAQVPA